MYLFSDFLLVYRNFFCLPNFEAMCTHGFEHGVGKSCLRHVYYNRFSNEFTRFMMVVIKNLESNIHKAGEIHIDEGQHVYSITFLTDPCDGNITYGNLNPVSYGVGY